MSDGGTGCSCSYDGTLAALVGISPLQLQCPFCTCSAGCPQAGWGLCINERVMKHVLLFVLAALVGMCSSAAHTLRWLLQHGFCSGCVHSSTDTE